MNKALISMGSNVDSRLNLEITRRMLLEHFGEVLFTEERQTEPYGAHYSGLFLNQLAVAFTDQTLDEVNTVDKDIECLLGRLPEHKMQGIVKVDIDVFGWNNEIVRMEDYTRPYVRDLLPQLESLLKR